MHRNTRLTQSRDNWRSKATDRSKTIVGLRKQLARRDFQLDKLARKNADLAQRLAHEKAAVTSVTSSSSNLANLSDAATIRALCVLLVVIAIVSFRSVPRILNLLVSTKVARLSWTPSFTSVINWTLRFGLAQLKRVGKISESWLAIIDCSIDVSTKKALVVLRVKLDALFKKGSAIGLEDCECIGIEVKDCWSGQTVEQALTRIFDVAGLPSAIIKDNGTDLALGTKLWRKKANALSVFVIEDVGHIMANALKATFGKRKIFNELLHCIKSSGAKLRQSDLAYLAPPKLRTKGRFQSIMNLANWGTRILALLGGSGRVKDDSIADRIRRFIPHFGAYRSFLEGFAKTNQIASNILKILKNHGLNQKTYQQVNHMIGELPARSQVRKKMQRWLRKNIQTQCRLGIGQMPLLVSSDIIESLFGKFKVIIQRNPKGEFNRIILAIPAMCGVTTEQSVKDALNFVTHTDLAKWERDNVASSQIKKKREFYSDTQPKTVRALGP
jgi:hypothetical protein